MSQLSEALGYAVAPVYSGVRAGIQALQGNQPNQTQQFQDQAQQMILKQILAQYPQLVRGILPQGAQAGVDAEMEIITAELQRRGVQGEQQITNNLQRRGMLNSSLYANQVGDMNSAIVRQLAQSRQDVTQQAIANMLAALGFGGQYQGNLAGQQLGQQQLAFQKQQAYNPMQYIGQGMNLSQMGG